MRPTRRILAALLILAMLLSNVSAAALADAILTLPAALQIIDEEAFYGSTSIDKVILSDNVTEIRTKAFANSTLSEINLPDSLTYIAEDAFDGLDEVSIYADQGTYAFEWAIENGYCVHFDINGVIYDAQDESGLSGVTIVIKDKTNQTVMAETTTNESGDFTVSLEPGNYVFHATKDGYKEIRETITFDYDTDLLEYYLESRYVSIDGTIYDAQDESGLSGVTIVIKDKTNETVIAETTTNAYGEFSFSLEPGKYVFYATKDGYKEIRETITFDYDTDLLEYYLESRYVSISGTIYDAQDEEGLSGVAIVIKDKTETVIAETTTNAYGEFTFSLEPGNYVFYATKDGYREIREAITLDYDTDLLEYYLESRYVSIDGTIYDAQDEEGLSGVTIVIKDETNETVIAEATTNESGDFTFSLEPGNYVFQAIKDGYKEIRETITIAYDIEPLEYYLESRYVSISGTIYDAQDEEGLSGVTIVIKDETNETVISEATTNESGDFTLSLEPGKYVFNITKADYKAIQETITISYDTDLLEYYLESMYVSIDGYISGALQGVQVLLLDEQGINIICETTTDAEGAFSLSTEPGQYILRATKSGYLDEEMTVSLLQNIEEIRITMLRLLSSDEYRIILSWGDSPADLDSHLVCYNDSGELYHVSFTNMTASYNNDLVCSLDIDVTSGYGPEVITLTPVSDCTYYYYVHNYSEDGSISTPSVQIEVYKGNNLIRTFEAPSGGEGIYWNVFAIVNDVVFAKDTLSNDPDTDYASNALPGYTPWIGYVTVSRVPTYESATSTNDGGHYVDNSDPVLVLGEEGSRYYIQYILTAGGTSKRWVDREYISETNYQHVYTSLYTSADNVAFDAMGGSGVFELTAPGSWQLRIDAPWLTADKTGGNAGQTQVTVTAEANAADARIGYIQLTCGTLTRSVSVLQSGTEGIVLFAEEASITGAEQAGVVQFAVGQAWSAETTADWLTLPITSGSAGHQRLLYQAGANQTGMERSGVIRILSASGTQSFTIYQSALSDDSSFWFTFSPASVMVGDTVTFTVHHDINTAALRLIADGTPYDVFDASGNETEFKRAFTLKGSRAISFQRMENGVWSEALPAQTLLVDHNDYLAVPQVNGQATAYTGEDYVVTVAQLVPNADHYIIYVYDPSGQMIIYQNLTTDELTAQNYQFVLDGTLLIKAGIYGCSVMVTGKDYSQAEQNADFTLQNRDYAVSFTLPHEGDEFVSAGVIHTQYTQTGGGYLNIRITDQTGEVIAEYPENGKHLTSNAAGEWTYQPQQAGEYTITGTIYPVDKPLKENTPATSTSVQVSVVGPQIKSVHLQSKDHNWTWVQASSNMKIYVVTNDAVDEVQIFEKGVPLNQIPVRKYTTEGWSRVFAVPVGYLVPGSHTVKVYAYDRDIVIDGSSDQSCACKDFTFYSALKLNNTFPVYPNRSGLGLVSSPINGSEVNAVLVGGKYVQPVTVTYDAADWYRVKTIDGTEGFIPAADVSRTSPEGVNKEINIISPAKDTKFLTGTQRIEVKWQSGFPLPEVPHVTVEITPVDDPTVLASAESDGFGSVVINSSALSDGNYTLWFYVKDIDNVINITSFNFQMGLLTNEEKYQYWFIEDINHIWFDYWLDYGVHDGVLNSSSSAIEKLNSIIPNGVLQDQGWILPCLNWKVGTEVSTANIEDELENDMLSMIADTLQKQPVAENYTANVTVTERLIMEAENMDIRDSAVDTVFSGMKAALNAARTTVDIVALNAGVTEKTASDIKDLISDIIGLIIDEVEIGVTNYVESYDAQVLLAAYVDVYKNAMIQTCDDYVFYLKKAYFGTDSSYKGAMTAIQSAAQQYIDAFEEFKQQIANLPSGASVQASSDEAVLNAVKKMLSYCGVKEISLETLKTASVDLRQVLSDAMPDIVNECCDRFLEQMIDTFIDKLLENENFKQRYPALTSIPGKELATELIGWFEEGFEFDVNSFCSFKFNMDAFVAAIGKSTDRWAITIDPEMLLQDFAENVLSDLNASGEAVQKYIAKNYTNETFKNLPGGLAKAIHGAVKDAWKTGTSIGAFGSDASELSAAFNGRGAFQKLLTLLYLNTKEKRDIVRQNSNLTEYVYGANSPGGNINWTIERLEKIRAALVSCVLHDIQAIDYLLELKKIHIDNQGWNIIDRNNENNKFTYNSYPSVADMNAQRRQLTQYLDGLQNVPDYINAILPDAP